MLRGQIVRLIVSLMGESGEIHPVHKDKRTINPNKRCVDTETFVIIRGVIWNFWDMIVQYEEMGFSVCVKMTDYLVLEIF